MLIVVIDDPYDRFRYNRQAYEMAGRWGASTASVHIADPVGRAKSVVLTDEGLRQSEALFQTLFTRSD